MRWVGTRKPRRAANRFALLSIAAGAAVALVGAGGASGGATPFTASALAVQPDGKIVIAGTVGGDIALARYLPAGGLDPAFGVDGTVVTDVGEADAANAVAVGPGGTIVVAGTTGASSDVVVARYTSTGAPDPSFGTAGHSVTDLAGSDDTAHALLVLDDGSVIVGGAAVVWSQSSPRPDPEFALARYTSDGQLDTSFDGDGIVITRLGGADVIRGLALDDEGRIVAAGSSGELQATTFALARYDSSGALDATFGTGGIVTTPFGADYAAAADVVVVRDRIVAVGSKEDQLLNTDVAVAAYLTSGVLDRSFGDDGRVTIDLGARESANAVTVDNAGRLVVAGGKGVPSDFLVLRLGGHGRLDRSFGRDGVVTLDLDGFDVVHDIAIQQCRWIVAVGAGGLARFDRRGAQAAFPTGD